MVNLFFVEQELKFAKEQLHLVVTNATSQPEINWRHFVGHLEKLFTDLLDITVGTPLHQEVKAALAVKKSDELLDYVRNARNTVHHSAKNITAYKRGEEAKNVPVQLISMTFRTDDGTDVVQDFSNSPVHYLVLILTTVNKEVRPQKGKKYSVVLSPPKTHMSNKLTDGTSPIEVGTLAYEFYEGLIKNLRVLNK